MYPPPHLKRFHPTTHLTILKKIGGKALQPPLTFYTSSSTASAFFMPPTIYIYIHTYIHTYIYTHSGGLFPVSGDLRQYVLHPSVCLCVCVCVCVCSGAYFPVSGDVRQYLLHPRTVLQHVRAFWELLQGNKTKLKPFATLSCISRTAVSGTHSPKPSSMANFTKNNKIKRK